MENIEEFSRLFHMSISAIGGLILFFIWLHVRNTKLEKEKDWGILLIFGALVTWVVSGAVLYRIGAEVNFDPNLMEIEIKKSNNVFLIRVLSTFNNGFFVASLAFFNYGFEKIKKRFSIFKNSASWVITILIFSIILILVFSCMVTLGGVVAVEIVEYLELSISIISVLLMGYALIQSFYHRGYSHHFTVFVAITALFLIITQIDNTCEGCLSLDKDGDTMKLILLLSQTTLIILFLMLGKSWVIEKKVLQEKSKTERITLEYQLLKTELEDLKIVKNKIEEELFQFKNTNEIKDLNPKENNNQLTIQEKIDTLSTQELVLFEELRKGQTLKTIANNLNKSEDTLKSQIRNIKQKLNVNGLGAKTQLETLSEAYYQAKKKRLTTFIKG